MSVEMTDDEVMSLAAEIAAAVQERTPGPEYAVDVLALALSVHCAAKHDDGEVMGVRVFEAATTSALSHLMESLVHKRVEG